MSVAALGVRKRTYSSANIKTNFDLRDDNLVMVAIDIVPITSTMTRWRAVEVVSSITVGMTGDGVMSSHGDERAASYAENLASCGTATYRGCEWIGLWCRTGGNIWDLCGGGNIRLVAGNLEDKVLGNVSIQNREGISNTHLNHSEVERDQSTES